ncbi:MAG: SpvB/TcaC N-terminal domain-containing protein [Cycloclasticus sp.]|nr:SpvB/TcaC N-terminal domain-containing protein [Cycloclasticus sp.]
MPSISLPKGGGAINGIGEKFSASPVTGTGSISVPLSVSPGRSGFGPQLSLSYNSGSGNGPFSFGWDLSLPSITRKTDKGLPQYQDATESDVYILSGTEDLVPYLEPSGVRPEDDFTHSDYLIHRYRPRIEGLFARIERWSRKSDGDIHWRTISKDNILTLYGKDADSRVFDPENPRHIFEWLICETRDTKGNAVLYQYKKENGAGVDLTNPSEQNRGSKNDSRRTAQRYIKHIIYGNRLPLLDDNGKRALFLTDSQIQATTWLFQVVFDYGEHTNNEPKPYDGGDWNYRRDAFSSYRAGFEVRTTRLCSRVLMFHHFKDEADVGDNCLVRSTDLHYSHQQNANDKRNATYTFLTSATQTGYKRNSSGGYHKRSMPAVEFEYSQPVVQETVEELDTEALENLPIGVDGASYQWNDLYGEGIPGVLTEQATGWYYKRNISPISEGTVKFSPIEKVALKPSMAVAHGAQFMDLAGDGQPDLVAFDGSTPGFYESDGGESWQPFRPFLKQLNRSTRDPNLKFIDLNGDGHADILISEDDALVWHTSLAEEGFGPAQRVSQTLDDETGPRIIFSDSEQTIYLADLVGDGLTDIVRIRNGNICYWPNLGYCRFGAKVTMAHAPNFDTPDQFNQNRIRLTDIDGSGTTDIIYLHRDGVRLYFNQSGNSWSAAKVLNVFPQIDDLASIVPQDLLGNSTACLVWSSALPNSTRHAMRYVNLMGSQKPHLLIKSLNNLGAETYVHYAPSTKFYLKDKSTGNPWITKLPFPVHVVERVETYDHISHNRFVTRYEYHHGYFDGNEREFRGFGMVEQWDTENFAALSQNSSFPTGSNVNEDTYVPPVYTKSWFHTGAYLDGKNISHQYETEYYREANISAQAFKKQLLPDTVLPENLNLNEEQEAVRALKGSMLRQEVYAQDGSDKEQYPYTVVEQNLTTEILQPKAKNHHGVFLTYAREAITFNYERNPADPRTQHALTLQVDNYGNVLKSLAIGYGRREGMSLLQGEDKKRQEQIFIRYSEITLTNAIDDIALFPHDYLAPLLADTKTYDLTGFEPTNNSRFSFQIWTENNFALLTTAENIPYSQTPDTLIKQKRLIENSRVLYRPDDFGAAQNNPQALLPLLTLEPLALPGESYQLAFSSDLINDVFQRNGQDLLPNLASVLKGHGPDKGGYVDSQKLKQDGLFPNSDPNNCWWIPSGRTFFSSASNHTPAQEAHFAKQHFYTAHRFRDPFLAQTTIQFDQYDLLMEQTQDALGNRVTVGERLANGNIDTSKAGNDYRLLAPWRVMDANRNRSQVAFDILGMVVGTAIMGKPEETLGDSLEGFNADLPESELLNCLLDPFNTPHSLLKKATTRLVYDLFAYQRGQQQANPQILPGVVYTLARETHTSALTSGQQSNLQHNFSYSDGFGQEIQHKIQAEAGPVPTRDLNGKIIVGANGQPILTAHDINPRWVGSGWTIFNNKGMPVRQYEPFFTDTHRHEFDVKIGVSSIVFYDAAQRAVATLNPDHTWGKVVFDPWQQKSWDANDTLLISDPATDEDVGGYFSSINNDDYLPTWHALRTNPVHSAMANQLWPNTKTHLAETQAAKQTEVHYNTPTVAHSDSLGRTFYTLVHNKTKFSNTPLIDPPDEEYIHSRIEFDNEGNQRKVIDAKNRVVIQYEYNMLGQPIYQLSMEAGARWMLNDIAGNSIRSWDSRGHGYRAEYDILRRPLCSYVMGEDLVNPNLEFLTDRTLYGEQHPEAEQRNLRGTPYLHIDQAGAVTSELQDFKGNAIEVTRRISMQYKQVIDWSDVHAVLPSNILVNATTTFNDTTLQAALSPKLESETFTSNTSYDAYNRPTSLTTPHSASMQPSTIRPSYNQANLLEKIEVVINGATTNGQPKWTPFVTNINYDAKGQRQRIDYANSTSTFYNYDTSTHRLSHLLTKRNTTNFPADCPQPPLANWPGCQVQNLRYTYDPVGNITHLRDDAQQTIYFKNKRVEPNAQYTYDALYRLIEATGREHLGQNGGPPLPHTHSDTPRVGLPQAGDGNAMGTYLERYVYDALGNFLQMQHRGTDPSHAGWARTYSYNEASLIEPTKKSNRLSSTTLNKTPPITETYTYDAHGNMTHMDHLSQMRWDYRDQLQSSAKQVVTSDATAEITFYVYDASGQRVRKVTEHSAAAGQIPKRKQERIYLGGFEIYRVYENDGTTIKLERETLDITDDKQRVAAVEIRTQGSATNNPEPARFIRYQLSNHLGSASLELDEAGKIISYEEYSPYGSSVYQAVKSQTQVAKRIRYSGKEKDEESGLYYYGARYYLAWLGRWGSCDPAGLVDGGNLYRFVRGNSITYRDSNGKVSDDTKKNVKQLGRDMWTSFKSMTDVTNTLFKAQDAADKGEYSEAAAVVLGIDKLADRALHYENGGASGGEVVALMISEKTGMTGMMEAATGDSIDGDALTGAERLERGIVGATTLVQTVGGSVLSRRGSIKARRNRQAKALKKRRNARTKTHVEDSPSGSGDFVSVDGQKTRKGTPSETAYLKKSIKNKKELSKSTKNGIVKEEVGKKTSVNVHGGSEMTVHTHPKSKVALFSHGDIELYTVKLRFPDDALHSVIGDKWPQTRAFLIDEGLDSPPIQAMVTEIKQSVLEKSLKEGLAENVNLKNGQITKTKYSK